MLPLNFSAEDAESAYSSWGFNCGPAAACAVSGHSPDSIHPHLRYFEKKRYTTPTLMSAVLRGIKLPYRRVYESQLSPDATGRRVVWPNFGLVRIQWDGPWTDIGRPMVARYRHSHWIASSGEGDKQIVFDINALDVGGWIPFWNWAHELVPKLLLQVEPNASGDWWPTHCWEVRRQDAQS